MKLTARNYWMIVKVDVEKNDRTKGGIYLAENREKPPAATGVVLSFGDAICDVKKGDHVAFGMYAGEELVDKSGPKEVKLKLLHTDDVIAFIE